MRKLVVFLIIMSTALASCADYLTATCNDYAISAVSEFGPSCIYPQCFGAAGRYKEAAQCYACQGNSLAANTYYQKAADYYILGITFVGPSGDYPLRAPSFENAGDMVALLGQTDRAAQYYDSALAEYAKIGDTADINLVTAKKTALSQPVQTEAPTGEAISAQNLGIGIILIIAVVAIVLFIRMRTIDEEPIPVPKELVYTPEHHHEAPKITAKESAKEKMREKIRRKYGLA
jgi:tetratricopeptide (TPR) repeat protein